jgi:hypothetical protein
MCIVCAFYVPLCGGTAFDVRAGLFSGSELTDKMSTLRSGLYGGKFTSHTDRRTAFTAWLLVDSHSLNPHIHPYHHHSSDWGLMFDVTCQSRFYVGFDVHLMCILCALDVPLLLVLCGVGPKPSILCGWGFYVTHINTKPQGLAAAVSFDVRFFQFSWSVSVGGSPDFMGPVDRELLRSLVSSGLVNRPVVVLVSFAL